MSGRKPEHFVHEPPRSGAPAPAVGVIMLQTRFPRPVGDIGNSNSFGFPVLREVVPGASARLAVRGDNRALLQPFIAAGQRLVQRGAVAITTSCGFLSLFQRELALALPVPVAASSLMQVGWVQTLLPPGKRCGVLTIDRAAFDERHLHAAGAPPDTPIAGVPASSALVRTLFDDSPILDLTQARTAVVGAARTLVRRHPEVGAIILECTNLPPYRADIQRAVQRPVFDIGTLVRWLWQSAQNLSAQPLSATIRPRQERSP